MFEEPKGVSDAVQPEISDLVDQEPRKDSVAYETYRKILSEKKKADEKLRVAAEELEAYRRKEQDAVEARLKDEKKWKEYAELKEKEAAEATAKAEEKDRIFLESQKLDAFLSSMDGRVDRKYWGFVNTDKIILNPETGEVDTSSVKIAIQEFKQKYPEIINYPGRPSGIPNESPKGQTSTLTYDDWKKLPVKEMKERYGEMIANDRSKTF